MDGKTTSEDYGSGSRGGVVDLGACRMKGTFFVGRACLRSDSTDVNSLSYATGVKRIKANTVT